MCLPSRTVASKTLGHEAALVHTVCLPVIGGGCSVNTGPVSVVQRDSEFAKWKRFVRSAEATEAVAAGKAEKQR